MKPFRPPEPTGPGRPRQGHALASWVRQRHPRHATVAHGFAGAVHGPEPQPWEPTVRRRFPVTRSLCPGRRQPSGLGPQPCRARTVRAWGLGAGRSAPSPVVLGADRRWTIRMEDRRKGPLRSGDRRSPGLPSSRPPRTWAGEPRRLTGAGPPGRTRHPHDPGNARTQGRVHDNDLHPRPEPAPTRRAQPAGSAREALSQARLQDGLSGWDPTAIQIDLWKEDLSGTRTEAPISGRECTSATWEPYYKDLYNAMVPRYLDLSNSS